MRVLIFLVCVAAAAAGGWKVWSARAESHPPDIVAPNVPHLRNLDKPVGLMRDGYGLYGR